MQDVYFLYYWFSVGWCFNCVSPNDITLNDHLPNTILFQPEAAGVDTSGVKGGFTLAECLRTSGLPTARCVAGVT